MCSLEKKEVEMDSCNQGGTLQLEETSEQVTELWKVEPAPAVSELIDIILHAPSEELRRSLIRILMIRCEVDASDVILLLEGSPELNLYIMQWLDDKFFGFEDFERKEILSHIRNNETRELVGLRMLFADCCGVDEILTVALEVPLLEEAAWRALVDFCDLDEDDYEVVLDFASKLPNLKERIAKLFLKVEYEDGYSLCLEVPSVEGITINRILSNRLSGACVAVLNSSLATDMQKKSACLLLLTDKTDSLRSMLEVMRANVSCESFECAANHFFQMTESEPDRKVAIPLLEEAVTFVDMQSTYGQRLNELLAMRSSSTRTERIISALRKAFGISSEE